MSWVVVDTRTGLRSYEFPNPYHTIGGARRAITRRVNAGSVDHNHFTVKTVEDYMASVPMVTRHNLMTGEPFQIRADAPACIDPSRETYWRM